jgi:hypothetical protein
MQPSAEDPTTGTFFCAFDIFTKESSLLPGNHEANNDLLKLAHDTLQKFPDQCASIQSNDLEGKSHKGMLNFLVGEMSRALYERTHKFDPELALEYVVNLLNLNSRFEKDKKKC